MPKPKKLKSGSWNLRVYDYTDEHGKKHMTSITAPTKAECERRAAEYIANRKPTNMKDTYSLTVGDAVDLYIEKKKKLSPTTLQSYKHMRKTGFPHLMDKKARQLSNEDIRMAIEMESWRTSERTGKLVTAKTIKNEWGLISSALKYICGLTFVVELPALDEQQKELPDFFVVYDIVKNIEDPELQLPCLIALTMGMRLSEIRGLMCSHIHGDHVFLQESVVDVDGEAVRKDRLKTKQSKRGIPINKEVLSLIIDSEPFRRYKTDGVDRPLVPQTRNSIYGRWQTVCKHNGIEMSFHDFRHLFASMCRYLGIPNYVIMMMAGWKSSHMLDTRYGHVLPLEEKEAMDNINAYIDNINQNVYSAQQLRQ